MSSESPHQLSLGSKTLGRAKFILGSLLLISTIVVIAGIYQGITSGDFDKALWKPLRDFFSNSDKTIISVPTPSFSPIITPTSQLPAKKSAPAIQQPAVSNCIRFNIREGEFASNKCYLPKDYDDLQYYLGRYNDATFSLKIAEDSMKITCNCR